MNLDEEPVEHQQLAPRHLAYAKFTADMVETMHNYFENYAMDGVVTLEVTDCGIWIKNPCGGQQFLGSTEVFGRNLPVA